MISRKRIIRFAIGTMMRQDRWEKKYNANHQFDVNQYDYLLITKLIANTVFKLNCTHN